MKIIIASDIYGRTPELEEFVGHVSTDLNNAAIVDPYEGEYLNFRNEDEAYRYFQQKVGFKHFKDTVFEASANIKQDLLLIGFSVGASAIWAISDKLGTNTNAQAICFYGSQIRNFADVNPNIFIELIFPKYEAHFNVSNLISKISVKNNVTCGTVNHLHGFMNKRSVNFNQSAYDRFMSYLKGKMA